MRKSNGFYVCKSYNKVENYMLELNKIYNGNCMNILSQFENESIDLIVTDPPYKITSRGNSGSTGGMLKTKLSMNGNIFTNNAIDCEEYAKEFYRVLKDGSHCYVMCNNINLIHFLNTFTGVGFHFVKSLIWDKGNKIMGRFYMTCFEYILFFRKGKAVIINNCGTPDLLAVKQNKHKDVDGKNLHDTEKPVRLMRILIENSSKAGDIVLDPFCGIGSTCIAAKLVDRKYIGVEIDEKYCSIANERLIKDNPCKIEVLE